MGRPLIVDVRLGKPAMKWFCKTTGLMQGDHTKDLDIGDFEEGKQSEGSTHESISQTRENNRSV